MANRLGRETSPYLRQHADNPVDWYPWGEEAFRAARDSGKPVLLSIGYAACHWCHVMAHESFEDPETARLMNDRFVNIKVDREERPDLDHIYQTAHQLLARRGGGWPLTVFLTGRKVPFAAGTYFPRTGRFGLPGFSEVLTRIHGFYVEHRDQLESPDNRSVIETLDLLVPKRQEGVPLSPEPVEALRAHLRSVFDPVDGGFGGAPKFPHSQGVAFLLDSPEAGDREMALLTLRKMGRGGICDQIGGGFARYSVDEGWEIPHFEKMLYDNGPLLGLYARAFEISKDPFFRRVAEETAAWADREMLSPEGLWYASLDADSEGEEGKFARWTRPEVEATLAGEERRVAMACLGFLREPNFEHRFWNPVLVRTPEEVAQEEGGEAEEIRRIFESARRRLFEARERRIRPGRDEKILTSWNALYLKGLFEAGRILGRPDWIDRGIAGLSAVRTHLWKNGRLLAVRTLGESRLPAYLDDYAFLLEALLESLSAVYSEDRLSWAREIAAVLLNEFEDKEEGGFLFTARDHEELLCRIKTGHDQSLPNGNGVAARSLLRLGSLLGDLPMLEAAERTLLLFAGTFNTRPEGFDTLLSALSCRLSGAPVVILQGPEAPTWQKRALASGTPVWTVLSPSEQEIAGKRPGARGATRAWICGTFGCLPPVEGDPEVFLERLSGIGDQGGDHA
ncbi:MAG: thioredoxin domain-containing protein [Nitrospirae bacterium]|nr:thioredoxin domain-containing protein [Nitrospirota bacterium]